MIRAVIAVAVIVIATLLGNKLVGHHEPSENLFHTLYKHVEATPVEVEHAELSIPFPMPGSYEGRLPIYNLQIFQLAAVALLFVLFSGVATCIKTGRGDYLSRLFAGFALWVRDEMVFPVMGRETGTRFLPLFLSVFFFILFMNLLGLLPGGSTATANVGTTGGMAAVTLCMMIGCGMAVQGPWAFWKNLLPHGLPIVLVPLMALVELVGLVVKPFALTIRLFANMTAGHLVLLSAVGLIFYFGAESEAIGYGTAPLAIGFAVFITIIEWFVACLQAYIFAYLSILFVQMSIHPEH